MNIRQQFSRARVNQPTETVQWSREVQNQREQVFERIAVEGPDSMSSGKEADGKFSSGVKSALDSLLYV